MGRVVVPRWGLKGEAVLLGVLGGGPVFPKRDLAS